MVFDSWQRLLCLKEAVLFARPYHDTCIIISSTPTVLSLEPPFLEPGLIPPQSCILKLVAGGSRTGACVARVNMYGCRAIARQVEREEALFPLSHDG